MLAVVVDVQAAASAQPDLVELLRFPRQSWGVWIGTVAYDSIVVVVEPN